MISDQGRVRLGHALMPTGTARRRARLGPRPDRPGRGLRRDGRRGQGLPAVDQGRTAAWTVAYDAADTQALSLAATARRPGLRRHRAERPGGRGDRPQASRLASRSRGPVHLGPGRRHRRATSTPPPDRPASSGSGPATASGRWSSTARQSHLLCVAVGPDGTVYAGSDGEGLIYRVGRGRQGLGRLRRPPGRGADAPDRARRRPLRRHGRRGVGRIGVERPPALFTERRRRA